MDIRWKKFRYGTEERNPSWSFFGSILCLEFSLIALAMAYQRNNGMWTWGILGLWFLVFSAISLVSLSR